MVQHNLAAVFLGKNSVFCNSKLSTQRFLFFKKDDENIWCHVEHNTCAVIKKKLKWPLAEKAATGEWEWPECCVLRDVNWALFNTDLNEISTSLHFPANPHPLNKRMDYLRLPLHMSVYIYKYFFVTRLTSLSPETRLTWLWVGS